MNTRQKNTQGSLREHRNCFKLCWLQTSHKQPCTSWKLCLASHYLSSHPWLPKTLCLKGGNLVSEDLPLWLVVLCVMPQHSLRVLCSCSCAPGSHQLVCPCILCGTMCSTWAYMVDSHTLLVKPGRRKKCSLSPLVKTRLLLVADLFHLF